jgi:hypothetical protein
VPESCSVGSEGLFAVADMDGHYMSHNPPR